MAQVFLSYSTVHRALAACLAEQLEREGFSVWWDTSLLPAGNVRDEVHGELDAAKVVLVIWTPESLDSRWVHAGADHGYRHGKLVNTHTPDLDPRRIPKPLGQAPSVELRDIAAIIAAVRKLAARNLPAEIAAGQTKTPAL